MVQEPNIQGDACCRTDMRSIGFKSQHTHGVERGGGPQTINHPDFDENDPTAVTHIVNPCTNHLHKEMQYVVKTVKKGVCDECVKDHEQKHHEIVTVPDTINECRGILLNIEANSLTLLSDQAASLDENKTKLT